jgi:hypothetical protein
MPTDKTLEDRIVLLEAVINVSTFLELKAKIEQIETMVGEVHEWRKQRDRNLVGYKQTADLVVEQISHWFNEAQPDLVRKLEVLTGRVAQIEGWIAQHEHWHGGESTLKELRALIVSARTGAAFVASDNSKEDGGYT